MKTTIDPSEIGSFSSTQLSSTRMAGHGRGPGLVLPAATAEGNWYKVGPKAFGVEAMSIGMALGTCEWAVGPLLREAQGQADLALATLCAFKLARRIEGDGYSFGRPLAEDTSIREAISAGVTALALWRSGYNPESSKSVRGCERFCWSPLIETAARICWRAVVESMSSDGLGDSRPLSSMSEDWLASVFMPCESRHERLNRLKVERAARSRSRLLVRRVEALKSRGGRGRRAMACEKIGFAARLLLAGEDLDRAATLAGFKAVSGRGARGGGQSAGDRLIRACARIGLRVVGSQRVVCQFRADGNDVAPTVTWHRQRDFSGSRFPNR